MPEITPRRDALELTLAPEQGGSIESRGPKRSRAVGTSAAAAGTAPLQFLLQ